MSTRDLRVIELQVAVDVLEARHLSRILRFEHRRPLVQLVGVGVLHRELIEGARPAAAEIDRRLVQHEDPDAGELGELGPQLTRSPDRPRRHVRDAA